MVMKGWSGKGWTHQGPLFAYTTIRCPGRAPVTRPAIVSVLSRPPCAAGGILLNSIDGPELVCRAWHPDIRRESRTKEALLSLLHRDNRKADSSLRSE